MGKIKKYMSLMLCGFSTFTIIPNTNYAQHISLSPTVISRISWQKTGQNLRDAIDKVGAEIEKEKSTKRIRDCGNQ